MISDKLAKFDESQRISVAALIVLAAASVCYFTIIKNSVVKLQDARADYASMRNIYAETEHQRTELLNLQKQLEDTKKQLQERQKQHFSSTEASRFFESINPLALAHNLRPISHLISEPKNLNEYKTGDKKVYTQQETLKIQSVKITVSGNFLDIVDFMNELAGYRQKVRLTNLRITLPADEGFNPKASFEIILIIDLLKDAVK